MRLPVRHGPSPVRHGPPLALPDDGAHKAATASKACDGSRGGVVTETAATSFPVRRSNPLLHHSNPSRPRYSKATRPSRARATTHSRSRNLRVHATATEPQTKKSELYDSTVVCASSPPLHTTCAARPRCARCVGLRRTSP